MRPMTPAQKLADLRMARDCLLKASDWTQMPDAPLSDAQKQSWREYRQALRDLPSICSEYDESKIPAKPQ